MATQIEILNVLNSLSIYYGKQTPRQRAAVYVETLSDLEPEAIEYAAQVWIKKSPFFPRVCELREAAGEYRGPVNLLDDEFQRMCDTFYYENQLDPVIWESLAKAFDRAGRVHKAAFVREKFLRLAKIGVRGDGIIKRQGAKAAQDSS